MKHPCRLALLALFFAAVGSAREQTPATSPATDTARPPARSASGPDGPAAALLEELRRVEPDAAQTYKVVDVFLRRDAVRLHLEHGTLVFLQPAAGRVTGAFFEGTGEVLLVPPERAERQQLVKFTGSPLLAESFASAYFRFTDATYPELHAQLAAGRGQLEHAPEVLERWGPLIEPLNRLHSLRLLQDFLEPPRPYFAATLQGQRLGAFDIVVDERRAEPVQVGQFRWRENQTYYDIWCSFASRPGPPVSPGSSRPLRALAYRIQATLTPERELEATSEVDLELPVPGPRTLIFELSRFLRVAAVTVPAAGPASPGADLPVEFFQNSALNPEEARVRASDMVLVVLPATTSPEGSLAAAPTKLTLRFRYHGQVISDVGNGVLFVGARGSWYPSIDSPTPAHYELSFRTPRPLALVATGTLKSTREDGEWKESLWVSEVPLPVAGFNVGNYESWEVHRGGVRVTAYANRELESRLARAVREPAGPVVLPGPRRGPWRRIGPEPAAPRLFPAPPTVLLEQVANDVANALTTFSELFGPFPYPALEVSQIPGSFGQGYPGLLYLSTFSFLPDADQARMGLSERHRELFSQLTPAHETAHQWWGNWVRVPSYRDQWLAESLAAYSALLFLEQQPGGKAFVREWLERYRGDLVETDEEGVPMEAAGALTLGRRLQSSRSPNGFVRVIYSKGPWVIHMLREMLRDPKTGSDALFLGVLRDLARGGEAPLTTAEFERRLEAVLPAYADVEKTRRLDWFFQQWIFDTGIPRYKLRWELRGSPEKGWRVEGSIEVSGVPATFTMPVPLYAQSGSKRTRLGTVVVTGEKTAFRFPVKVKPDAVLLDPHLTVLALRD